MIFQLSEAGHSAGFASTVWMTSSQAPPGRVPLGFPWGFGTEGVGLCQPGQLLVS